MKLLLLPMIMLLLSMSGDSKYDFLYEAKTLSELREYEKSINSKELGFVKKRVSEGYFPTAKPNHDYYPLCYLRTNDSFYPTLNVTYYYDENDSTLLASSYDWNILNHMENLKKEGYKLDIEKKRKKEYLAKYNSIKQELISKYGQPTEVSENKSKSGYFYKLTWDNESTQILLQLKFSKKLKYITEDMKVGSFRIRMKVDYI